MIRSNALTKSAEGQDCTLQIAGVCHNNTETTVLAHLPDESAGRGLKADDISACFACSDCHSVLDGHTNFDLSREDKEFYMRRAQVRTWRIWRNLELISIKGDKEFKGRAAR